MSDPAPGDDLAAREQPQESSTPTQVYRQDGRGRLLVDLATAYRWPLVLGSAALALAVLWFSPELPEVPPEATTAVIYAGVGSLGAVPAAWWFVQRFRSPSGVEVLDLDPVGHSHRHLRVGSDVWGDLEVRSPWGSECTTADLQDITLNGRTGYEVADFRVLPDGTPRCVATWMGEADGSALRTYKYAVVHARERLSKRAQANMAKEAAREQIVTEAAERVVASMIRESERSGVPNGEQIQDAVGDVLSDMGMSDPLRGDLPDSMDGVQEWTPDRDAGAAGAEQHDRGPGDEPESVRLLEQLGEHEQRENGGSK